MTTDAIANMAEAATTAEALRRELLAMPSVGYSNYKQLMVEYRRILNDMLVLIRDIAILKGD